jgi:hypothetical protein
MKANRRALLRARLVILLDHPIFLLETKTVYGSRIKPGWRKIVWSSQYGGSRNIPSAAKAASVSSLFHGGTEVPPLQSCSIPRDDETSRSVEMMKFGWARESLFDG